jgi:hypothetical protein
MLFGGEITLRTGNYLEKAHSIVYTPSQLAEMNQEWSDAYRNVHGRK